MSDETLAQFEKRLAENPLVQQFVTSLLENKTKEFLQSNGVATDKITPQQMIGIAKIVCEVAGPLCSFVNSLPG